ncbi:hypothetical protein [Streptomyces sp. NBC_01431]|nr:hypothetical protein [Streptomyces sp. NBC_01431]
MFQVSLKAVDNAWAKWLAGGREALVAQPRGRRVGEDPHPTNPTPPSAS